jgi:hypothetical protein
VSQKALQIATPKNMPVAITETEDALHRWSDIYFAYQVTTSPRSQKEQQRDFSLFLSFMDLEFSNTSRLSWPAESPSGSTNTDRFLWASQWKKSKCSRLAISWRLNGL